MVREILIVKLKADQNVKRLNKKNAFMEEHSRKKTAKSNGLRRKHISSAQETAWWSER